MAAYNAAIYVGRALSFAAVIVAGRLGMGNVSAMPPSAAAEGGAGAAASAAGDVAGSVIRDIGVTMVPLDKLDLSQVSLLYTQGEEIRRKEREKKFELLKEKKVFFTPNIFYFFFYLTFLFFPKLHHSSQFFSSLNTGNMAAITPIYDYDFTILHNVVTEASWRQLLFWLGPPGLVVAALALLTLDEPRHPAPPPPATRSRPPSSSTLRRARCRGRAGTGSWRRGPRRRAKAGGKIIGGASVVSVAPARLRRPALLLLCLPPSSPPQPQTLRLGVRQGPVLLQGLPGDHSCCSDQRRRLVVVSWPSRPLSTSGSTT